MFSIGQLAARTGVKVPTIRYYEQMGLLEPDERTDGNQRRYSTAGLRRLAFIKHGRDLGLPLDMIETLLGLQDKGGQACTESHAIATAHLGAIRDRIEQLQRLEHELTRIARSCDGHPDGPCDILQAFGDHHLCDGAH